MSRTRERIADACTHLREAERLFRAAAEGGDPDETARWQARDFEARIDLLISDAGLAARGHEHPSRVHACPIGEPPDSDPGGGFGDRALQALAVCREAVSNADTRNYDRMVRAMAWIARTWIEMCGDDKARVVRAVVTRGWDVGRATELVAAINAAAEDQREAAVKYAPRADKVPLL